MTQRIVLITGASSGLGRAMALDLTARGHTVYGTSRNPAPGDGFATLPLDVRDAGSAAATVQRVLEKEGRIDVLINNAGYAFVGAFEETGVEDARAQFETNVFGAMRMMKAVLPHMRANGWGRIVNISSASGLVGTPFLSAYAASKHALEALSESLSFELRGTNIRVTLIEPDGMKTGIRFHHPAEESPHLKAKRLRFLAMLEQSTAPDGGGVDPQVLADRVAEVVASDNPPLRIVIGANAEAAAFARKNLPEAEFAAMVAHRFGLDVPP